MSSPRSGHRGISNGHSRTRKPLTTKRKTDSILVRRALLASNPIERRGGPRFPLELAALSLHLTSLGSENAPPSRHLPVPGTLQTDEPEKRGRESFVRSTLRAVPEKDPFFASPPRLPFPKHRAILKTRLNRENSSDRYSMMRFCLDELSCAGMLSCDANISSGLRC